MRDDHLGPMAAVRAGLSLAAPVIAARPKRKIGEPERALRSLAIPLTRK